MGQCCCVLEARIKYAFTVLAKDACMLTKDLAAYISRGTLGARKSKRVQDVAGGMFTCVTKSDHGSVELSDRFGALTQVLR